MTGKIIKICGLTDPGNIMDVISQGPDWIGMIFYPLSPRYVANPGKLAFLKEMTSGVKKIGVFVNQEYPGIREILDKVPLDGIQLHGNEPPELCRRLKDHGYLVIKAFGIGRHFRFTAVEPYCAAADFFLFDTPSPRHGGTGEPFDWNRLQEYQKEVPFLLAGGISPDMEDFPGHPKLAGVDLNSRFETSPGIKDIRLLEGFINRYRNGN
jgi:phosphoribosylanthranilate isomerase